jgi:hypothetical protein
VCQPETRNPRLETIPLRDLRSRRLGREQNINQFLECGVRPFVDFVDFNRANGVLHDQHRMIRRAESFLLCFCERLESVGDYGDGEAPAFL